MCTKKHEDMRPLKTSETVSFHTFIACLYLNSLDGFYAVQIYFKVVLV